MKAKTKKSRMKTSKEASIDFMQDEGSLDFILNDFSCYCLVKNIKFKHTNQIAEVVTDWLKNHSRSVGKSGKLYSKKELISEMRRFKEDTEMFSTTPFRKKYGSKMAYSQMEDKWIEENL